MIMDFVNDLDSEDPHPLGLLGGGEHFADIQEGRHGANRRSQRLAMQQSANDMNMSLQGTYTVLDPLIHNRNG